MFRTLLLAVAATSTLFLLSTDVSARGCGGGGRGGCGGGHHGGGGGCGGGYCGGGYGGGYCGGGYCGGGYGGYCGGGYGGGYYGGYGGCSTCGMGGYGGYTMGGSCPGGVCSVAPTGTAGAQYTLVDVAPATLVVNLPADAKLVIGGQSTASVSDTRVFTTPQLERGSTYSYTLTATVVRDGKTETITRDVTVRAGEQSRVDLGLTQGESVASR